MNSPLRYPGGKRVLIKYIEKVLEYNNIHGTYCEPYAGGAGVAVSLLVNEKVDNIIINDIDIGIYSFWHYSINYPNAFCKKIKDAQFSIEEWKKQKNIYLNAKKPSKKLAFATFYLNRVNRSGIITAGVIGGLSQNGNYKMSCRFNKEKLIDTIMTVSKFKSKITITNLDAIDFIDRFVLSDSFDRTNSLVFLDPPYVNKAKNLYLNYYKEEDHKAIQTKLSLLEDVKWIVTYDENELIKQLYKEYRYEEYKLSYSAGTKYRGNEIIAFSSNIKKPCKIDSFLSGTSNDEISF